MIMALVAASYFLVVTYQSTYKILPVDLNEPPPGQDPIESWTEFTGNADEFTVMLPTPPQYANEKLKDPTTGEQRVYDMYVSEKLDGTLFMITRIVYPGESKLDSNAVFDQIKKELMSMEEGAELLSEVPAEFLGHPSTEYAITGPSVRLQAKAILESNKLYLLTYVVNKDQFSSREFAVFIDTFRFTNR